MLDNNNLSTSYVNTIYNVGWVKSFVDDLEGTEYCKHESSLCATICWGSALVPAICARRLSWTQTTVSSLTRPCHFSSPHHPKDNTVVYNKTPNSGSASLGLVSEADPSILPQAKPPCSPLFLRLEERATGWLFLCPSFIFRVPLTSFYIIISFARITKHMCTLKMHNDY